MAKIDGPGEVDRLGNSFGKVQKYSFGVSRDSMKKVYVDEILKKGRDCKTPGPDQYTLDAGFAQNPRSGSRYSIRPRNDLFVLHLKKQSKLPGPGNYHSSEVLIGKSLNNSMMQNVPSTAFSKAKDRFRVSRF